MENTMEKAEYVEENIFWNMVLYVLLKGLFFCCLPNASYFVSLLVFFFIAVLVTGIGILITWRRGRNYCSVAENIIMTWSLYLAIAYRDIYQKRVSVLFIVTVAVSVLLTIMVCVRTIDHRDRKREIIRRRVRKTIALWRRNTVMASLILLVSLAVSFAFGGRVSTAAEVNVEKVYGDEAKLDANIETISLIEPKRWEKLDVSQKLEVLQKIINCECRYNGISHEISLDTGDLSDNTLAYYNDRKHLIVIDRNHLDSNGYEVLKTMIHECTHAYQHEQVNLYRTLDEKSKNLLLFYEASIYMEEFDNYVTAKENPLGYYFQLTEINARKRAETDSVEYIERIREYLGEIPTGQ